MPGGLMKGFDAAHSDSGHRERRDAALRQRSALVSIHGMPALGMAKN